MTPLAVAIAALWMLVASRVGSCTRRLADFVFWAALAGALAATLMAPPVAEVVFGSLGTALPAIGSLVMLALWFVRAAVLRAVVPPEQLTVVMWRSVLQTAAAITAYCVSFVCALLVGAVQLDSAAAESTSREDIGMLVLTATLSLYVIVAASQIARTCLRYVPQMSSGLFRAGFVVVALGCALGILGMTATLLHEAIGLTALGLDARPALEAAMPWLTGGAAVLLAVGLVLPSLSRRTDAWQVPQRYYLWRLHPVWHRTAQSDLFFGAVVTPRRAVFSKDPQARLHRALVEILDSQLAAGGSLLTSSETKLVRKSEEAFYA
ncbi:MAG: hypothetical protein ACTHJJ_02735 [Intrasporangium sp.]|uniref:hypothetical protein n=1 Tax=Intrasporangium sp. TaxID=1925024 RepID=UPI003F8075AD